MPELSEAEYKATMVSPMRLCTPDDPPPKRISLREYMTEVTAQLELPSDLDIHRVYLAHGAHHTHVLFWTGEPDVYLAVIVDNDAERVLGHRLLDFRALYGLR